MKENKKEKKKINWLRVLWMTGMYIVLIIILYLVIEYKVKYEV